VFEAEAVPVPVPSTAVVTAAGTETILLAEDEQALRRLTRRILESAGYAVPDASICC
jgi:hypothetical protein